MIYSCSQPPRGSTRYLSETWLRRRAEQVRLVLRYHIPQAHLDKLSIFLGIKVCIQKVYTYSSPRNLIIATQQHHHHLLPASSSTGTLLPDPNSTNPLPLLTGTGGPSPYNSCCPASHFASCGVAVGYCCRRRRWRFR